MNCGETPNLALKKMLELFLKIVPFKKILLTKMKPMIENLRLTLSIRTQTRKSAKLRANIR